jgi:competence protein ComEC
VLTNSPKINLNRLLKVLRPRLIVVDNNNYKSYIERWKHTCLKKQVAFYNVKTDGAFVLK